MVFRWGTEELDILLEMTNQQLEQEAQDPSMTISWTSHWKKVSSKLKMLGHNRTPTACQGIWRRGVQEQQTDLEAAGPDWDESEHEILVHMTKKQLALERADQSNVIPWARHWKKVSLQLDESGYSRTPDNCAAYWALVGNDIIEDHSGIVGEENAEDEDGSLRADESPENGQVDRQEDDSYVPAVVAVTPPQILSQTPSPSPWSQEEYENLLRLLKERRELEEDNGLEMPTGSKLWIEITQSHKAGGFDRSWEACKAFWTTHGRHRSGYDERVRLSPVSAKSAIHSTTPATAEPSTANSSINSSDNIAAGQSKPSSHSSMMSPVDELKVEESIVCPQSTISYLLDKYLPVKPNSGRGPDLNPALSNPADPVPNDFEPDEDHIRTQEKRGADLNSSLPAQPTVGKSSSVQQKPTRIRFTPEQLAVLEAEALRTNGNLEYNRKIELSRDLGVTEKVIRTWFNNYNAKLRRSRTFAATNATVPTYAHKGFDDEASNEPKSIIAPAIAIPTTLNQSFSESSDKLSKRPYPDDGTSDQSRPLKKTNLEPEFRIFQASQGFNPVNSNATQQGFQGPSITALPARSISNDSVVPIEESGPSDKAPFQANRVSDGLSAAPPTVVQNSGLTTVSKNTTETPNQPPISHLNLQPMSIPTKLTSPTASQQTAPRPVELQSRPPIPFPTIVACPSILYENDNRNLQTSSTVSSNNATGAKNAQAPSVWTKEPKTSTLPTEPRPGTIMPDPTASVPGCKNTSPSVTGWPLMSPNRKMAQQFSSKTQQQDNRSSKSEQPASKPAIDYVPGAQPPDEDPRASALRHVDHFRSKVQDLNLENTALATRITALSEELSHCASKHNELIAARDVEIARVVEEINRRCEARRVDVRQLEKQLVKAKETDVESLKKNKLDLAKKVKGLETWLGVVEYYDTEGEEEEEL